MVSNQLIEAFQAYLKLWQQVLAQLRTWQPQLLNQANQVVNSIVQVLNYLPSGQPIPSPQLDSIAARLLQALKGAPAITDALQQAVINRCAGQMQTNQNCQASFYQTGQFRAQTWQLIDRLLICKGLEGLKQLTSNPRILQEADQFCLEVRLENLKAPSGLQIR